MLSEVEIFDMLSQSFRQAAERCELLAWHPRRGHIYLMFLKDMRHVEGCCRQAFAHREDARWLPIGRDIAEAQKRAGNWVRSSRTKDERNSAQRLFKKLAENLRALQYASEK